QQRERQADFASLDDFLKSIRIRLEVAPLEDRNRQRVVQMFQKSNQFNLTTRRYDEHQMQAFMTSSEWLVADFSLADKFGDSGIVGLAMFRIASPGVAELDTFLMSCRVIGRQAESAFLNALLRLLAEREVHAVLADYIPTAKNPLVKDLLPQHGFALRPDGRYQRDLQAQPAQPESDFPIELTLVTIDTAKT
ncbi:MAG: hypothetical protein K2Q07_02710, partial [Burkholderiaceae bacterium]|nr:hypothetical protein [Burkholderiaceae bacterium]